MHGHSEAHHIAPCHGIGHILAEVQDFFLDKSGPVDSPMVTYKADAEDRLCNIMEGLATTRANEIDGKLSDALRNFLFGRSEGEDLAGRNIFRGRDLGVPTYGGLAECYGLKPNAKVRVHALHASGHACPAHAAERATMAACVRLLTLRKRLRASLQVPLNTWRCSAPATATQISTVDCVCWGRGQPNGALTGLVVSMHTSFKICWPSQQDSIYIYIYIYMSSMGGLS